MKKLLLTAIIVTGILSAEEKVFTTVPKSYGYYYVGGLMPTIGVGFHNRVSQQAAIDVSFEVGTILILNRTALNVKYLNYYNPRNYIGIGCSFGGISWLYDGCYWRTSTFSPVLVKGWENKKYFTEVTLYFPTFSPIGNTLIPSFSISRGWKF